MLFRLPTSLLLSVVLLSTFVFGRALLQDPELIAVMLISLAAVTVAWGLRYALGKTNLAAAPAVFLAFVVLSCCGYVMHLANSTPKELTRKSICRNNLHQITIALLNYAGQHGSFPPAYIADKDGKPMHSWRVLILPYLGCEDLYDRYRFDEPWDGPNNKQLLGKPPEVYCCPLDYRPRSQRNASRGNTSYVAVVGAKAAWKGSESARLSDVLANTSKAILVMEVVYSDVRWTEPRDLDWDEIRQIVNASSGMTISAKHWMPHRFLWKSEPYYDSIHVALTDGEVVGVPQGSINPEFLESIAAVDHGYHEYDRERASAQEPGWNWWNCFSFAVWTGSVFLLLCRICWVRPSPATTF